MKVIFLDVDGVINNSMHMRQEALNKRTTCSWTMRLPEEQILRLKSIVDATKAIIIVSSSWRLGGFEKSPSIQNLQQHLNRYGLIVYGYTPSRRDRFRSLEIKNWIQSFHRPSDIYSFVVLDDDTYDLQDLSDQQVVCDHTIGLQDNQIQEAIDILNRPLTNKTKEFLQEDDNNVTDQRSIRVR